MPSPTKVLNWADEDSDDDWELSTSPVVVPPLTDAEKARMEEQARERAARCEANRHEAELQQQRKREEMLRREQEAASAQPVSEHWADIPASTYDEPQHWADLPASAHATPRAAAAVDEFHTAASRAALSPFAQSTPTRTAASTPAKATREKGDASESVGSHFPRKTYKGAAQQRILRALCGSKDMDVQALGKALDWKKTYSRSLGSLYAFVKRECKDLLLYDSKGIVRITNLHPMSGVHAVLTAPSEAGDQEYAAVPDVDDETKPAGAYMGAVGSEADTDGTHGEDASSASQHSENVRAASEDTAPTPPTMRIEGKQLAEHDVNDIAQSLLSMAW